MKLRHVLTSFFLLGTVILTAGCDMDLSQADELQELAANGAPGTDEVVDTICINDCIKSGRKESYCNAVGQEIASPVNEGGFGCGDPGGWCEACANAIADPPESVPVDPPTPAPSVVDQICIKDCIKSGRKESYCNAVGQKIAAPVNEGGFGCGDAGGWCEACANAIADPPASVPTDPPSDPTPSDPTPSDPTPSDPTPSDPTPSEPAADTPFTVTFHWLPSPGVAGSCSPDFSPECLKSKCNLANINDFLLLDGKEIPADWDKGCKDTPGSNMNGACWRNLTAQSEGVGPQFSALATSGGTLAFIDADGEVVSFSVVQGFSGASIRLFTVSGLSSTSVVACKTPIDSGTTETPAADPPPPTAKKVIFKKIDSSGPCELANINDFLSLNGENIPANWNKKCKDEVANGFMAPGGICWRNLKVRSGIADPSIAAMAANGAYNLKFKDADGQVVSYPLYHPASNETPAGGTWVSLYVSNSPSSVTHMACKVE